MTETKKVQKALPFKNKLGFTALPNEILKLYVSHPRWSANCLIVYMYLLHQYSEKWRYAYPTHDQIADNTYISRRSIKGIISRLQDMKLIEVLDNKPYDNHIYVPLSPISNRDDFERAFPGAQDNRVDFEKKRAEDKEGREAKRAEIVARINELHEQNTKACL